MHGSDGAPTADVPGGRLQVPPWVQLALLPVGLLFGYLFVQAASHAVVVFLVAGLISLLLAPLVRRLSTRGVPRLLSVLLVFGGFVGVVTVLTFAAVDLLAGQADKVRTSGERVAQAAVNQIDDAQRFADARGWDVDVRDQGTGFVEQLEERSTELSGEALELGTELVALLAEAAFNVVLIIVIAVYMLLDAPRISRLIASMLPADSGAEHLFARMERSLLRYTVGQTLASIVMGTSAALGLWLFGVTGIWEAGARYAVLFGIIVAVTEFAPSIGPAIGSVPPIATALFDGIGPAIAVAVFFLLLHQVEGHIVIPKLMGAAIAVHPLLVIFGILAGAQIMGIGGILLALPLLAVGRVVVAYLRERISFASWPTAMPVGAYSDATGATAGAGAAAATATRPATRDVDHTGLGQRARQLLERRPRRRRAATDTDPDADETTDQA